MQRGRDARHTRERRSRRRAFDAHTARSGVYTPSGVGLQLPGSVADAIVESAQYDPTSEHEQLLETLADGHLERTHTPVELPEAPDPDDRFPEQGSVRVTPELQSDLTNTVRDVSPRGPTPSRSSSTR